MEDLGGSESLANVADRDRRRNGLRRSVAADEQLDLTACRSFVDQAPKLFHTFDALAVVLEHHITRFNAGLFGGAAIFNAGDLHSIGFLQLQVSCASAIDLGEVHA